MERNTQTTIDELAIGDRFYRAKDRNRKVLEKIEHKAFVTKHYTYRHWALADGERHPEMFKNGTPVVYLRSTR